MCGKLFCKAELVSKHLDLGAKVQQLARFGRHELLTYVFSELVYRTVIVSEQAPMTRCTLLQCRLQQRQVFAFKRG